MGIVQKPKPTKGSNSSSQEVDLYEDRYAEYKLKEDDGETMTWINKVSEEAEYELVYEYDGTKMFALDGTFDTGDLRSYFRDTHYMNDEPEPVFSSWFSNKEL